jgi:uncharacterized membrane protein YhaH (DUF805 family)
VEEKKKPEIGSIEYKNALIKSCFGKMCIGVVLLMPPIMVMVRHEIHKPGSGLIMWLFLIPSAVVFVFALADYARSKGLHPAMGLLGLGSIFGLIILSIWPDKYPYNKEAQKLRRKVGRG